ncbi:unnamed protein product, partial [marine sediment metagenome]
MPDLFLKGEGDFSKLVAEHEKVLLKLAKIKAGLTANEKAAKRWYDSTRTPQERYNAKLAELNKLLKANKINQDTYGRAVRKSKDEMDAAGRSGQKTFGSQAISMVKRYAGAIGSIAIATRAATGGIP